MKKNKPPNVLDFQLYALAEKIKNLHKIMQEQGLFLDHRELLSCPQCHLMEDVTCEGKLIVYQEGARLEDTEYRFIPLNNKDERFKCPMCGTEIIIS